jgi:hypothetical protein
VKERERDNYEVTNNISYTLYITESRRHERPKLQIKIAGEETQALIDTGCEMSILNENLYNNLRVKKQALLEVNKGGGHKIRPSSIVVSTTSH